MNNASKGRGVLEFVVTLIVVLLLIHLGLDATNNKVIHVNHDTRYERVPNNKIFYGKNHSTIKTRDKRKSATVYKYKYRHFNHNSKYITVKETKNTHDTKHNIFANFVNNNHFHYIIYVTKTYYLPNTVHLIREE